MATTTDKERRARQVLAFFHNAAIPYPAYGLTYDQLLQKINAVNPSFLQYFGQAILNAEEKEEQTGITAEELNVVLNTSNQFQLSLVNTLNTNHLGFRTTSAFSSTTSFYHVVITLDGTGTVAGSHIWVNNSDQALTTLFNNLSASTTTSDSLFVGQVVGFGYLAGYIDEVSFWDKALNSSEVAAIYNGAASAKPGNLSTHSATANLLWWPRFGDLTDTISTIFDRKGSVNGTPTNMEAGDIVSVVP